MKSIKTKSTRGKRPMLLLSVLLLSWWMAGCSGSPMAEPRTAVAGNTPVSAREGWQQMAERCEWPIDFPFWESEPYSLVLALSRELYGGYELRLYDADRRMIQRIPCGRLEEPMQLSCGDVYYFGHRYLGIFTADSATGLFYAWEDERFSENPIEIPRYEESRGAAVLTVTEDDTGRRTELLYRLNWEKERMEPVRSRKLHRDTGFLEIWDYVENCCLFLGNARLDETGELVNREYYDMLLWEDYYVLWDAPEAESTIPTWGWDSEGQIFSEEYESREALLEAYGVLNSAPMYEYHDECGNLQLELYRNEDTGEFCGIAYSYYFNSEWEKSVTMNGFSTCAVEVQEWSGWEAYSVIDEGYNGSDAVEDYEEIVEYTSDGKPDYFKSQGIAEWDKDYKELATLVEINHIYRDDGTLFYREYHHNSRIFYTTFSYLNSFFDESGRPAYESGYITHGHLEYYYIYEEDGDKPAYRICLDYYPQEVLLQVTRYD